MVGHEKGIELAALEGLGEAFEMREVEISVWECAGIAPGAGMDGCRAHKGAEMKLPEHYESLRLDPILFGFAFSLQPWLRENSNGAF
jgi:hypothetical protein